MAVEWKEQKEAANKLAETPKNMRGWSLNKLAEYHKKILDMAQKIGATQ